MNTAWRKEFEERMRRFERRRSTSRQGVALSIKVRVAGGCFHREHSPHAYQIIDGYLTKHDNAETEYLEHESGPELLVILALATAGITLAKSVIDLITAIIKARSEGVKKGDKPSEPLELIVRRIDDARQYKEEIVLRIGHQDSIKPKEIEAALTDALKKLVDKNDS